MPNLQINKKWDKWYPESILFKNTKNNKNYLDNSNMFTEKDFYEDLKVPENNFQEQNLDALQIDLLKKEAYEIGFRKGLLKDKEDNIILNSKINQLCLDFEIFFSSFEKKVFPSLLKIVLIASSYVISKKISVQDEKILIKNIKFIIRKYGLVLKKPKLFVHPDNKILIEKTFKNFIRNESLEFIYDDSLDFNSCKIESKEVNIDATVDTRWQELCNIVNLEEY